jgi:RNA polymerase sigma factor (sigma-70 family)
MGTQDGFENKSEIALFYPNHITENSMKTILNPATDNQLVKLFQEGDNSALEALLERYKDRVFSSINFLVKDKFLAEDLFQEVFIKIIDTLRANRYNEEGKFLPWAMRIAHNLCVDHFRKVKRTPGIVSGDNNDTFDTLNVKEESAEVTMMQGQSYDSVRKIVDMLPEEQREVIVLRHFADLSFKEIAQLTNCSINTALGRMRYGLMNMRKLIVEKQIAL